MINLFSNDCTCAKYYNLNNLNYPHPIVWCYFPVNEYIDFIENFDTINFDNFEIIPINNNQYFSYGDGFKFYSDKTYYMNIDNITKISYPHYIESNKEITVNGNIFKKNIKEYVFKKYEERLLRFNKENETVFLFNERMYLTKDQLLQFINVKTHYNKILYTSYKELLQYNSDNIIIIYVEKINYSDSFIDFAKKLKKYL